MIIDPDVAKSVVVVIVLVALIWGVVTAVVAHR